MPAPTPPAHTTTSLVILLRRLAQRPSAPTLPTASNPLPLDPPDIARLEAEGWIEHDPASAALRITSRGRTVLRRARSHLEVARTRTARRKSRRARPAPAPKPASAEEDSPLTWLHRRLDKDGQPMISDVQHDAGERLRTLFWRAHMTPRVTAAWGGTSRSRRERRGPPLHGVELAESVVQAQQKVAAALKAVGPEHSDILIDVCGHLKGLEDIERSQGWPKRSAKILLQHALTALARHFGLITDERPEVMLKRRLRHWGALDYRPTLTRWSRTEPQSPS